MTDRAASMSGPAPRRPRHRAVWLLIAAVTAIVVIALLLWTAAALFLRHTHDSSSVYHRAIRLLRVNVPAGQVTIMPGPAGTITVSPLVRWEFAPRPEVLQSWHGGTLTISVTTCSRYAGVRSHCDVALNIGVPAGLAVVDATVGSGSIRLQFTRPPRRVTANVGTGSVAVQVPDDSRYRLVTSVGQGGTRQISRALVSRSSPRLIKLSAGTGSVRLSGTAAGPTGSGMAWAFQKAIGAAWYYQRSNPAISLMGTRTLQRILASSGRGDLGPGARQVR